MNNLDRIAADTGIPRNDCGLALLSHDMGKTLLMSLTLCEMIGMSGNCPGKCEICKGGQALVDAYREGNAALAAAGAAQPASAPGAMLAVEQFERLIDYGT